MPGVISLLAVVLLVGVLASVAALAATEDSEEGVSRLSILQGKITLVLKRATSIHGPVSTWTVQTTHTALVSQIGFPQDVVAIFLERKVDGKALLSLCYSSCSELLALGIGGEGEGKEEKEGEGEEKRKKQKQKEQKRGDKEVDAVEIWKATYLSLEEASFSLKTLTRNSGTGLEDASLRRLLEANRAAFFTFFLTMGYSPHVALGMCVGSLGGVEALETLIFGKDEQRLKAKWSWPFFFLAPGCLAIGYFWAFLDTDFVLVALLIASYATSDLSFWLELLLLLSGRAEASVLYFFWRTLNAFLICVVFFVALCLPSFVLPPIVCSVLFHRYALYVALLVISWRSLLHLLVISRGVLDLFGSLGQGVGGAGVVDERKRSVVLQALKAHSSSSKMQEMMRSDWRDMYEEHEPRVELGKGSFGVCTLAYDKQRGEEVCVKVMNGRREAQWRELVLELACACVCGQVGGGGRGGGLTVEKLTNLTLQKLQLYDSDRVRDAKHEIRVLSALRALNNSHLLRLKSAHFFNHHNDDESGGGRGGGGGGGVEEVAIVTNRVCPLRNLLLKEEELETRLQIVRGLFLAVAELHAAGVHHRDIKLDNVGVLPPSAAAAAASSNNNSSKKGWKQKKKKKKMHTVLIDFGCTELPSLFGFDHMRNICDPLYRCPELWAGRGGGSVDEQNVEAILALGSGFQGAPADVWAAGITALEIVCGGLNVNEIFKQGGKEMKRELHQCIWLDFDHDAMGGGGDGGGGGGGGGGKGRRRRYAPCSRVFQCNESDIEQLLLPVRQVWRDAASEEEGGKGAGQLHHFVAMIKGMLCVERSRRSSMKDAVGHVFWSTTLATTAAAAAAEEEQEYENVAAEESAAPATEGKRRTSFKAAAAAAAAADSTNAAAAGTQAVQVEAIALPLLALGKTIAIAKDIHDDHCNNNLDVDVDVDVDVDSGVGQQECEQQQQRFVFTHETMALLQRAFDTVTKEQNAATQELSLSGLTSVLTQMFGKAEDIVSVLGVEPIKLFRLLDTDASGGVARHELFVGLVLLLGSRADELLRLEMLFLAFDDNSDGELSFHEFSKLAEFWLCVDEAGGMGHFLWEMDMHHCNDDDGGWNGGFGVAMDVFMLLDKNHDNVVSLEEFVDGLKHPENKRLRDVFLQGRTSGATSRPGVTSTFAGGAREAGIGHPKPIPITPKKTATGEGPREMENKKER